MKIEHKAKFFPIRTDGFLSAGLPVFNGYEAPHDCADPDCPGNRNRLKLELFDEMLAALEDAVECGMVPKSSAADGGANKYSSQVKAADKIRSAIAKAKELK